MPNSSYVLKKKVKKGKRSDRNWGFAKERSMCKPAAVLLAEGSIVVMYAMRFIYVFDSPIILKIQVRFLSFVKLKQWYDGLSLC